MKQKKEIPHGVNRYTNYGCRCDVCVSANSEYSSKRRKKNIKKAREYERKYQREWREKNPERARQLDRESHYRNKEERNEYSREYYKKHKDNREFKDKRNERSKMYYENNKEKHNARRAVRRAVKRGELVKPKFCENYNVSEKCDSELQAHHEDYSKPLDVKWLCVSCHRKEHRSKTIKSYP